MYLESHLKPTWDWLLTVMDSTEAQLRFGASLTHASDPTHPSHPLHSAPGNFYNNMFCTECKCAILTLTDNILDL